MSYFDIKLASPTLGFVPSIYDPGDKFMTLTNAKVSLTFGEAGSFDFTIAPEHFYYGHIIPYASTLTVYEDGELIFFGRPLYPRTDIYGRKTFHCEGALAFLNDVIIPAGVLGGYGTDMGREIEIINYYNKPVPPARNIYFDTDYMPSGPNYMQENSCYKSCKEELQDILARTGGYFYIDLSTIGYRYLKWVSTMPASGLAPIEIGLNMLDMAAEGQEYYTAALATGAKIDDAVVQMVEPVISADVSLYGFMCKRLEFPDQTTVGDLEVKCAAWLAAQSVNEQHIDISALDLHIINNDYQNFLIGRNAHIVNPAVSLDATIPISSVEIDISTGRKTIGLGGAVYNSLTRPKREFSPTPDPGYLIGSNGSRYMPYVDANGDVKAQKIPDYIKFSKAYTGPYYVGDKIQLSMYAVTAYYGDGTTGDWTGLMSYTPQNGYVFQASDNPENFGAKRVIRTREFLATCPLNFAGVRPGPDISAIIPTPLAKYKMGGTAIINCRYTQSGTNYQEDNTITMPSGVGCMVFRQGQSLYILWGSAENATVTWRKVVTNLDTSEEVSDTTTSVSIGGTYVADGKTVWRRFSGNFANPITYSSNLSCTPSPYDVADIDDVDNNQGQLAWVLIYGGYT